MGEIHQHDLDDPCAGNCRVESPTDIIQDILRGNQDENLEQIGDAIRDRVSYLSRMKTLSFNIGDEVVFNSKVRPRYLEGVAGIVKSFKTKNIVVEIQDGQYVGRFGRLITTPPGLIDHK